MEVEEDLDKERERKRESEGEREAAIIRVLDNSRAQFYQRSTRSFWAGMFTPV